VLRAHVRRLTERRSILATAANAPPGKGKGEAAPPGKGKGEAAPRGKGKVSKDADVEVIPTADTLQRIAAVVGVPCFLRDGDTREAGPFALAEITQCHGPDQYTVKIVSGQHRGAERQRSLTELMGCNDVKPTEVHDLSKLPYIHEAAVSDVLRRRYASGKIYASVGNMLLVTNPFKNLGITTAEHVLQYRRFPEKDHRAGHLEHPMDFYEPHIFALCARALYFFANSRTPDDPQSGANISFVISGESGAGKTETTKHILSFFTTPRDGAGPDHQDPVSEAIMAGNPVLEAFGNATTARNNNSSRYGRLIRLYMSVDVEKDGNKVPQPEGVKATHRATPTIKGGTMTPFLLEKSRITHAAEKDRNYHVFYQMCKSLSEKELADLGLPKDWTTLAVLARTKQFDVPNSAPNHDQNEWLEVQSAYKKINVSDAERAQITRLLAAVIMLGEIQVTRVGDTDELKPVSTAPVATVELSRLHTLAVAG
jgi:myosin heavy subunit